MVKNFRFLFKKLLLFQVGKKVFDINKDVRNLFKLEKIRAIVKMIYLDISQLADFLSGYFQEILPHLKYVVNNIKKSTTCKDQDKECDMNLMSENNLCVLNDTLLVADTS